MQLTAETVKAGKPFSLIHGGENRTVEFITENQFLVWSQDASRACLFEVAKFGPNDEVILAPHRGDVSVSSHSHISEGDRCQVLRSYTGESPHALVAREIAKASVRKVLPRQEVPEMPFSDPLAVPAPKVPIIDPPSGGWQCPHCGTQNPGDPCVNCDKRPDED